LTRDRVVDLAAVFVVGFAAALADVAFGAALAAAGLAAVLAVAFGAVAFGTAAAAAAAVVFPAALAAALVVLVGRLLFAPVFAAMDISSLTVAEHSVDTVWNRQASTGPVRTTRPALVHIA
jgi:hypothetical protein